MADSDGTLLWRATADRASADFHATVPIPREVRFLISPVNRPAHPFAPEDPRELSIVFLDLRAGDRRRLTPRICPYPFARTDVPADKFIPCCGSWLTSAYHDLNPGDDPWNGPAAIELRSRILGADYSLCDRDQCRMPLLDLDELRHLTQARGQEAILSEANLAALERGDPVMPEGPSGVTVVGDPRCNLACPSCRPSLITRLDGSGETRIRSTQTQIEALAGNLRTIKLAGDGEVFFSPFLRESLRGTTRDRYPKLEEIHILTNGLLMNERTFRALRPGSDLIQRVNVSVDAGTAEVYRRVRGGDWDRLVGNLRWAGAQRRLGRFRGFALNFTVRYQNFRTMRQFVELAREVGADQASFRPVAPWPRSGFDSYEAEAVHLPAHADHREFLETVAELRADGDPVIDLQFLPAP